MGLKGVSDLISPDLLFVLSSMGHGDEIVLADNNFPSSFCCQANGAKLIRADGHPISLLLTAILKLFPLDTYVPHPYALMQQTDGDRAAGEPEPPVWATYKSIIENAEQRTLEPEMVERFMFYERAKRSFAIVHTGETAKYGNIVLVKGLINHAG